MHSGSANEQTLFMLVLKQVKAAHLICLFLILLISVCKLCSKNRIGLTLLQPPLSPSLSLLGVGEFAVASEFNQQLLSVDSMYCPLMI